MFEKIGKSYKYQGDEIELKNEKDGRLGRKKARWVLDTVRERWRAMRSWQGEMSLSRDEVIKEDCGNDGGLKAMEYCARRQLLKL